MRIRKNMLANYLAKCIISILILLYGNIKSSQKQHYTSLVAITCLNLVRQVERQTFTCHSVLWKSCLKNFGNSVLHHFSPHPSCMACPNHRFYVDFIKLFSRTMVSDCFWKYLNKIRHNWCFSQRKCEQNETLYWDF